MSDRKKLAVAVLAWITCALVLSIVFGHVVGDRDDRGSRQVEVQIIDAVTLTR